VDDGSQCDEAVKKDRNRCTAPTVWTLGRRPSIDLMERENGQRTERAREGDTGSEVAMLQRERDASMRCGQGRGGMGGIGTRSLARPWPGSLCAGPLLVGFWWGKVRAPLTRVRYGYKEAWRGLAFEEHSDREVEVESGMLYRHGQDVLFSRQSLGPRQSCPRVEWMEERPVIHCGSHPGDTDDCTEGPAIEQSKKHAYESEMIGAPAATYGSGKKKTQVFESCFLMMQDKR